jgi:hypothetical protein
MIRHTDQAEPVDEGGHDLVVASGQYMRDEISMDKLEQIQRLNAKDLKATILRLDEPRQSNWLQSFIERLILSD